MCKDPWPTILSFCLSIHQGSLKSANEEEDSQPDIASQQCNHIHKLA